MEGAGGQQTFTEHHQEPTSPVSPHPPTSPTRVAHQLQQHKHHGLPIGAVPVMPLPQQPPLMKSPTAAAPPETADLKQSLAHSLRRPPTPPSDEDEPEPEQPAYAGYAAEPVRVLPPSAGRVIEAAPEAPYEDESFGQEYPEADQTYMEPLHQEQQQQHQQPHDQRYSVQEHPLASPTHPMADTGLTAVALYDYEAGDNDEISFEPDDIITNIDMVDAGWWRGECRGKYGLFPANYVELRQH